MSNKILKFNIVFSKYVNFKKIKILKTTFIILKVQNQIDTNYLQGQQRR